MKLVILAGGYGSRLGDITNNIPKPMVEIGGKPILWHIMKIYSHYGIKDFIICLGYKANFIKEYFLNYEAYHNDFTKKISDGSVIMHTHNEEADWKITLVDTGLDTLKGARLKKIEKYLDDDINLLTYGDGLADINIQELIAFHKSLDKVVTISGVHPPARFGELEATGNILSAFKEKAQTSVGLINGGFMVFKKELLDHLTEDDGCDLEYGVLEELAVKGEISVYKHEGFWSCMDHERDMQYLIKLWNNNKASWKVWE